MDRERARQFIEQHEGRRKLAYADSEGVLTIGIGRNLEERDVRARIEALGVDYTALCAQQCALSDTQVNCLFSDDLDSAINDAIALVPNFWEQPEDVRLATVDMIFNLGGPRFSTFVKFLEALENRDYLKAAAEMARSNWARQVPNRAADDIALVRGCAT